MDHVGIAALFNAARAEPQKDLAIGTYRKALALWEASERDVSTFRNADLISQVYRGLAYELDGMARESSWLKAIDLLRPLANSDNVDGAVVAFGMIVIDYFQDRLTPKTRIEKQKYLAELSKLVERSLSNSTDAERRAELLATKSAMLRQRATIEASEIRRAQRLSEAQRCIQLATKGYCAAWVRLELQLISLEIARTAKSDLEYAEVIREVTKGLSAPDIQQLEAGRSALAALLRFTNQPLECCEQWSRILAESSDSRPLYRAAHIYAEAATQLSYKDFPAEIVRPHMLSASRLAEEALAAGYGSARLIIGTAFLTAELAGADQGAAVLQELYNGAEGINWQEAIRLVAREDASDAITRGLAVGIDQSGVWCRLGTFVSRYQGDPELSESLFRTSLRLNQRNAVALTDLARLLIRKKSPNALVEATRLLKRAQNFADRRFHWWREVQNELDLILPAKAAPSPTMPLDAGKARNISDLRRRFRAASVLETEQKRGYELEELVFLLAKMTLSFAAPSYHADRVDGEIRQIDGYLEHRSYRYRIECKWTGEPIGQNEVSTFRAKLDVAGVDGLIFSIGGFRDTAITRTVNLRDERPILLIDGDEVRSLFEGRINLDEMLSLKRSRLNQYSNPYFRVTDGGQILDSS